MRLTGEIRAFAGNLWFQWILATVIALTLGRLGLGVADMDMPPAVEVGIYGVLLGVLQWLVLRRVVEWASWWVLASVLGGVLAGGIGGAIPLPPEWSKAVNWTVQGGMLGVVLGVVQWPVLFLHIARSGLWIPASTVAYAVGYGVAAAVPREWGVGAHWAVYGAVAGAGMGFVLDWLLQRPLSTDSE